LRNIGKILWLLPVAAHIGYILATHDKLPDMIGAGDGEGGTDIYVFIVQWFALVGFANLAFAFIHVRLPRFSDKMLSVPNKNYWLANTERRARLVERIREQIEATLLMMNIFFLAVYQNIYQTNVQEPVIQIRPMILVPFFMILPLVIILGVFLFGMRSLASEARKNKEPIDEESSSR
jgi:hypothetical protein